MSMRVITTASSVSGTRSKYLADSKLSHLEPGSRKLFSEVSDDLTRREADRYLNGGHGVPENGDLYELVISPEATAFARLGETIEERTVAFRNSIRLGMVKLFEELEIKDARYAGAIHLNTATPHAHILINKNVVNVITDKQKRLERIPQKWLYGDKEENGKVAEIFAAELRRKTIATPPPSVMTIHPPDGILLPHREPSDSARYQIVLDSFSTYSSISSEVSERLVDERTMFVNRQGGLTFIKRDEKGVITGYTSETGRTKSDTGKGYFYIGDPKTAAHFVIAENVKETVSLLELTKNRDLSNVCFVSCDGNAPPKALVELLKSRVNDTSLRVVWAFGLDRDGKQKTENYKELRESLIAAHKNQAKKLEFISYSPKAPFGKTWNEQITWRNAAGEFKAFQQLVDKVGGLEAERKLNQEQSELTAYAEISERISRRLRIENVNDEFIVVEKREGEFGDVELGRYTVKEDDAGSKSFQIISVNGSVNDFTADELDDEILAISRIEDLYIEKVERQYIQDIENEAETELRANNLQSAAVQNDDEITAPSAAENKEHLELSKDSPEKERIKKAREKAKKITDNLKTIPLEEVMNNLGLSLIYDRERRDYVYRDNNKEFKIKITDNLWCDRYDDFTGGRNCISLVMHVRKEGFADARKWLIDNFGKDYQISHDPRERPQTVETTKERKPLVMPARNDNNLNVVRTYLSQERGISLNLVDEIIDDGIIYANGYKSVVFVHRDPSGEKITGASWRATSGTGRADVAGTNKDEGWFYIGNFEKAKRFVITEAPIEALSYYQLHQNEINLDETVVMAVSGNYVPVSLIEKINRLAGEKAELVLAVNNDQGGERAFFGLLEKTGRIVQLRHKVAYLGGSLETTEFAGKLEVRLPNLEDWNDDLKALRQQEADLADAEHIISELQLAELASNNEKAILERKPVMVGRDQPAPSSSAENERKNDFPPNEEFEALLAVNQATEIPADEISFAKIVINESESPHFETPLEFDSITSYDNFLKTTPHPSGGVYKTDAEIHFNNGEIVKGRFDIGGRHPVTSLVDFLENYQEFFIEEANKDAALSEEYTAAAEVNLKTLAILKRDLAKEKELFGEFNEAASAHYEKDQIRTVKVFLPDELKGLAKASLLLARDEGENQFRVGFSLALSESNTLIEVLPNRADKGYRQGRDALGEASNLLRERLTQEWQKLGSPQFTLEETKTGKPSLEKVVCHLLYKVELMERGQGNKFDFEPSFAIKPELSDFEKEVIKEWGNRTEEGKLYREHLVFGGRNLDDRQRINALYHLINEGIVEAHSEDKFTIEIKGGNPLTQRAHALLTAEVEFEIAVNAMPEVQSETEPETSSINQFASVTPKSVVELGLNPIKDFNLIRNDQAAGLNGSQIAALHKAFDQAYVRNLHHLAGVEFNEKTFTGRINNVSENQTAKGIKTVLEVDLGNISREYTLSQLISEHLLSEDNFIRLVAIKDAIAKTEEAVNNLAQEKGLEAIYQAAFAAEYENGEVLAVAVKPQFSEGDYIVFLSRHEEFLTVGKETVIPQFGDDPGDVYFDERTAAEYDEFSGVVNYIIDDEIKHQLSLEAERKFENSLVSEFGEDPNELLEIAALHQANRAFEENPTSLAQLNRVSILPADQTESFAIANISVRNSPYVPGKDFETVADFEEFMRAAPIPAENAFPTRLRVEFTNATTDEISYFGDPQKRGNSLLAHYQERFERDRRRWQGIDPQNAPENYQSAMDEAAKRKSIIALLEGEAVKTELNEFFKKERFVNRTVAVIVYESTLYSTISIYENDETKYTLSRDNMQVGAATGQEAAWNLSRAFWNEPKTLGSLETDVTSDDGWATVASGMPLKNTLSLIEKIERDGKESITVEYLNELNKELRPLFPQLDDLSNPFDGERLVIRTFDGRKGIYGKEVAQFASYAEAINGFLQLEPSREKVAEALANAINSNLPEFGKTETPVKVAAKESDNGYQVFRILNDETGEEETTPRFEIFAPILEAGTNNRIVANWAGASVKPTGTGEYFFSEVFESSDLKDVLNIVKAKLADAQFLAEQTALVRDELASLSPEKEATVDIFLQSDQSQVKAENQIDNQTLAKPAILPFNEQKGNAEKRISKLLHALRLEAEILENPNFFARIDNEPWMPLYIERNGDLIRLYHQYKQNGDAINDSMMAFRTTGEGILKLYGIAPSGMNRLVYDRAFAEMFSRNVVAQNFREGKLVRLYEPEKPEIVAEANEKALEAEVEKNIESLVSQEHSLRENDELFSRFENVLPEQARAVLIAENAYVELSHDYHATVKVTKTPDKFEIEEVFPPDGVEHNREYTITTVFEKDQSGAFRFDSTDCFYDNGNLDRTSDRSFADDYITEWERDDLTTAKILRLELDGEKLMAPEKERNLLVESDFNARANRIENKFDSRWFTVVENFDPETRRTSFDIIEKTRATGAAEHKYSLAQSEIEKGKWAVEINTNVRAGAVLDANTPGDEFTFVTVADRLDLKVALQLIAEYEARGESVLISQNQPEAKAAETKPDFSIEQHELIELGISEGNVTSIADTDGAQSSLTVHDNNGGERAVWIEPKGVVAGTRGLAEAVRRTLNDGFSIGDNRAFNALAEEHFGGTRAEGRFTPRDAYDALEAGVNAYLMDNGERLLSQQPKETLNELRALLKRLPTQSDRTDEQVKFQQFSTPPTQSFIAYLATGLTKDDIVLEPSAGNAGLALWSKAAGNQTHVNEISERRSGILKMLGFENVTRSDAQFLNDTLPLDVRPTVVLMNPPFSATGGRTERNRTIYGAEHISDALLRLENGGRLVAIVGEGMGMDKPTFANWWAGIMQKYNVRANIGIDGDEYYKYGTNFGNQILVIDKTGKTPGATTEEQIKNVQVGQFKKLDDALDLFIALGNERRSLIEQQKQALSTTNETNEVLTNDERVANSPIKPGTSNQSEVESLGILEPDSVGGDAEKSAISKAAASSDRIDAGRADASDLSNDENGLARGNEFSGERKPESSFQPIVGGNRAFAHSETTNGNSGKHSGVAQPDNLAATNNAPLETRINNLKTNSTSFWIVNPEFGKAIDHALDLIKAGGHEKAFPKILELYEQAGDASNDPRRVALHLALNEIEPGYRERLDREAEDRLAQGTELQNLIEIGKQKVKREVVTEGAIRYAPAKFKGGVEHPGHIVESASMAAVEPPDIIYQPNIDPKIVSEGKLSNLQYESVIYAGQRHEMRLPSGARAGFYLGDGTGVGKGRQLTGIALDNWNRNNRRILWLSINFDLVSSAKRDLDDLGAAIPLARLDKHSVHENLEKTVGDSILFGSYSTLIGKGKDGKTRFDQIVNWLGEDGVIMFDEGHLAKNAVPEGMTEASQRGEAVLELQTGEKSNPNWRIVYSSATGATTVRNMAYMERLGIWGEGTGFPGGFVEFQNTIERGGVGAMEMVARDLKAAGMYCSRSLSYRGVKYEQLHHELTPEQVEIYNSAAKAWGIVAQHFDAALDVTGADGKAKAFAMSRLWATQQLFFRQLMTAMKVPSTIEEAERILTQGVEVTCPNTGETRRIPSKVLIGIIGTGEARTKEQMARAAQLNLDFDELDFSPKQMLLNLVEKAFPTQRYTVKQVGDREVKVKVVDEDGRPVESQAAIAMREALLEDLEEKLRLPDNPLDQIVNYFGENGCAEITGRDRRIITDRETGEKRYVKRARAGVAMDKASEDEMNAFQSNRKRVAVISQSASTGISLDSDVRPVLREAVSNGRITKEQSAEIFNKWKEVNEQRQSIFEVYDLALSHGVQMQAVYHLTQETSWSADTQMQTFGRSHRSSELFPPTYGLLSTNLGGEKRFLSTIAKRLGTMGALTKGDRDQAGGGDLLQYDFENFYGEQAAKKTVKMLERGNALLMSMLPKDPETGLQRSGIDLLYTMGIAKKDGAALVVPEKFYEDFKITTFLNRTLMLDVDTQNTLFNAFTREMEAMINNDKQNGLFDEGVRDIEGINIRLAQNPQIVSTDRASGAKTYYYKVEADIATAPVSLRELAERNQTVQFAGLEIEKPETNKGKFFQQHQSHNIIYAEYVATRTDQKSGQLYDVYRYARPGGWGEDLIKLTELNDKYREAKLDDIVSFGKEKPSMKVADWWNQEFAATPKSKVQTVHIIGGAVLPIWQRLNSTNDRGDQMSLQTVRVETEEGERIVGVRIPPSQITRVLRDLGATQSFKTPEEIRQAVLELGETVQLVGGLRLQRTFNNKQPAIELTGLSMYQRTEAENLGLIKEIKNFQSKYFIPTEDKKSISVLTKLLERYPGVSQINEKGETIASLPTSQNSPSTTSFAAGLQSAANKIDDLVRTTLDDNGEGLPSGALAKASDGNSLFMEKAQALRDKPLACYWWMIKVEADEKNRITLNPAGYELVRQTYKTAFGKDVIEFEGMFNEPATTEVFLKTLENTAKQKPDYAVTLKNVIKTITDASQRHDSIAIFIADEGAVQEEEFHLASFLAAAGQTLKERHARFDELIQSEEYLIAKPVLAKMYKTNDDALLLEEYGSKLASGQGAKLGLTNDQSKKGLRGWFESFAERNGEISKKKFEELSAESARIRQDAYHKVFRNSRQEQADSVHKGRQSSEQFVQAMTERESQPSNGRDAQRRDEVTAKAEELGLAGSSNGAALEGEKESADKKSAEQLFFRLMHNHGLDSHVRKNLAFEATLSDKTERLIISRAADGEINLTRKRKNTDLKSWVTKDEIKFTYGNEGYQLVEHQTGYYGNEPTPLENVGSKYFHSVNALTSMTLDGKIYGTKTEFSAGRNTENKNEWQTMEDAKLNVAKAESSFLASKITPSQTNPILREILQEFMEVENESKQIRDEACRRIADAEQRRESQKQQSTNGNSRIAGSEQNEPGVVASLQDGKSERRAGENVSEPEFLNEIVNRARQGAPLGSFLKVAAGTNAQPTEQIQTAEEQAKSAQKELADLLGEEIIRRVAVREAECSLKEFIDNKRTKSYEISLDGETEPREVSLHGLDLSARMKALQEVQKAKENGWLEFRQLEEKLNESKTREILFNEAHAKAIAQQAPARARLEQQIADEAESKMSAVTQKEADLMMVKWKIVEKTQALKDNDPVDLPKPALSPESIWRLQERSIHAGDLETFRELESLHREIGIPRSNMAFGRLEGAASIMVTRARMAETAETDDSIENDSLVTVKLRKEDGKLVVKDISINEAEQAKRNLETEAESLRQQSTDLSKQSWKSLAQSFKQFTPSQHVRNTLQIFTNPVEYLKFQIDPIAHLRSDAAVQIVAGVIEFAKTQGASISAYLKARQSASAAQAIGEAVGTAEVVAGKAVPTTTRELCDAVKEAVEHEKQFRDKLLSEADEIGEDVRQALAEPKPEMRLKDLREMSQASLELRDKDLLNEYQQMVEKPEMAEVLKETASRAVARNLVANALAAGDANAAVKSAKILESGELEVNFSLNELAKAANSVSLAETANSFANKLNPTGNIEPHFTSDEMAKLEEVGEDLTGSAKSAIDKLLEQNAQALNISDNLKSSGEELTNSIQQQSIDGLRNAIGQQELTLGERLNEISRQISLQNNLENEALKAGNLKEAEMQWNLRFSSLNDSSIPPTASENELFEKAEYKPAESDKQRLEENERVQERRQEAEAEEEMLSEAEREFAELEAEAAGIERAEVLTL